MGYLWILHPIYTALLSCPENNALQTISHWSIVCRCCIVLWLFQSLPLVCAFINCRHYNVMNLNDCPINPLWICKNIKTFRAKTAKSGASPVFTNALITMCPHLLIKKYKLATGELNLWTMWYYAFILKFISWKSMDVHFAAAIESWAIYLINYRCLKDWKI